MNHYDADVMCDDRAAFHLKLGWYGVVGCSVHCLVSFQADVGHCRECIRGSWVPWE